CPTRADAGPATAMTRAGPTTRTGATWSCSTSISTAKPAKGWGPATRPDGPRWSFVIWKTSRASAMLARPRDRKVTTMNAIQTVEQLEQLLSEPTEAVVETMRRLQGDIILLGAGGKIGPSLARMARRASDLAGVARRVIGVSRFSNAREEAKLQAHGIETMRCDLLDEPAVAQLPNVPNLIYLAGMKFGSSEDAASTWAMNAHLPGVVCRKYRGSRIVAFSTGAVYGFAPRAGGGSRETDSPQPVGEYAMSCLGRERLFEYYSRKWSIPVALIRLFYACELRYGVLVDLARTILAGAPVNL